MFSAIFLIFLQCEFICVVNAATGCEIDPFSTSNAPILVTTGTTSFVYPKFGENTIQFEVGDVVDLACPGGKVVVDGTISETVIQATCISNQRFRILGGRFLWRQVSCNQVAEPNSRFTNRNCEGSGREAEIGFDLGSGRFLRTIQVCYDTINQSPLYTHFDLTASIGSSAVGTPRPSFHEDTAFYNIGTRTVHNLYVRAQQRKTINTLIGLNSTSTKYIDAGSIYFLSKGHLTARSDFIYPAQQNATFRYINAAPQWQSFNGFNWNQAEIDTRSYASKNNVNLKVWTGIYGVATLPHETTGKETDLYLYVSSNVRAIPVPALYWKIIYNSITTRGIALIGLNNPYQTNVSKNIICTDVSNRVTWLKWNKTNISQGYSYACTIDSFRRVVNYAPNLSVSGLLV